MSIKIGTHNLHIMR